MNRRQTVTNSSSNRSSTKLKENVWEMNVFSSGQFRISMAGEKNICEIFKALREVRQRPSAFSFCTSSNMIRFSFLFRLVTLFVQNPFFAFPSYCTTKVLFLLRMLLLLIPDFVNLIRKHWVVKITKYNSSENFLFAYLTRASESAEKKNIFIKISFQFFKNTTK